MKPRPPSDARIDRLRNWTCNHFSISDGDADVSRLLRKIADAIEELGEVDILDITFCMEVEGPKFEAKMTVYCAFPDEA